MDQTKEKQYQRLLELNDREGVSQLGLMSNFTWHEDPKRLLFVLSRYKFVAKMLKGKQSVLEIGCADAFASRIVLQEVESLTAVDFDELFIKDAQRRADPCWKFECKTHDILEGPVKGSFDAAYALDVIEHIPKDHEDTFIRNIHQSLSKESVFIVGTPSLESQAYASEGSKEGHVNLKTADSLQAALSPYFHQIFNFSMNDEVVHTGFAPMAHYLFAVCCSKRSDSTSKR